MIVLLFVFGFVFVGWLIFGDRENPYIKTHKRKWENDKNYKEYLRWLDKQGGDNPLNKADFKEDIEIMNEVNKHISR